MIETSLRLTLEGSPWHQNKTGASPRRITICQDRIGAVAQLGERLVRNQKAEGSIPFRSIIQIRRRVFSTAGLGLSFFNSNRLYLTPFFNFFHLGILRDPDKKRGST